MTGFVRLMLFATAANAAAWAGGGSELYLCGAVYAFAFAMLTWERA